MFSFFAVIWDPTVEAQCAASSLVKRRLAQNAEFGVSFNSVPGLFLAVRGASPAHGTLIHLENQQGIIAGTIFQRPSAAYEQPHRVFSLKSHDADNVISTRGKCLLKSHWGSYVAFLAPPSRDASTIVLRAPLGLLPCFYTRYRAITLAFSIVEDCVRLGLCQFSVNWDRILAQAIGGDYLGTQTTLNEVKTLVGGDSLAVVGSEWDYRLEWSPSQLSDEEPAANVAEASDLLRSCTRYCMQAWASVHKTAIMELSGGFDSSVVLACMRETASATNLNAVNLWSRASGDERNYARSMARLTQTPLREIEREKSLTLTNFVGCALTASPVFHYFAYDSGPKLRQIAHELGATAIFNGEVGDDIFGHAPTREVLAEVLISNGFGRRFGRASLDYATLKRISIWNAIAQARSYRGWLRERPFWSHYLYREEFYPHEETSATAEAVRSYEERIEEFIHPWLSDVRCMPAGRVMLIRSLAIATSTAFHSMLVGDDPAPTFTPLASEPLFRVFTRIPSHFHYTNGISGAVARQAFGSAISTEVLGRGTGKGTPEMWIGDLLLASRAAVSEVLLEGMLVKERILDRATLERLLSDNVAQSRVRASDIVKHLYIEGWLRRWSSVTQRSVA